MTDRHISWPNLQKLIESGSPARFPIPGEPHLEMMMETGGSALSLLVPLAAVKTVPATTLEAIRVETIRIDAEEYVRIVTRVRPLYQEFYLLLTEIADSIQLDQEALDVAVRKRLDNWKELLRSIGLLSADQQLGLLGELWVLNRLISVQGPVALESWTGPLAEPHDFRFAGAELEVKTTKNRQRSHVINGLEQLKPSLGVVLYLISIQLEPANTNDATSLPQMVTVIRSALGSDPARQSTFDRILVEGCSYRETDARHYGVRFRLRSQPMLIPVDSKFPRLTREMIREAVGNSVEQRILEVRYTVNVDDLGNLDGTAAFHEVLPAVT